MAKNAPLVNAIDAMMGGDDYLEDLETEAAEANRVVEEQSNPRPKKKTRVVEESVSEDLYEVARSFLRVWMTLHLKGKVDEQAIDEACSKAAVEELYSSYEPGENSTMPIPSQGPKLDPNDPRGACEYRVSTFIQFTSTTGKTLYRGVSLTMRPSVGGW